VGFVGVKQIPGGNAELPILRKETYRRNRRPLRTRIYEHKYYTHMDENLKSNMEEHSLNDNHQTKLDKKKIAHKEKRTISRTAKECEFIITRNQAIIQPHSRSTANKLTGQRK
jgi:hypothetical protein